MSSKPEIVKEGWLKRVKNQKKRYFVLCFNKDSGAAQLQYYENERKFTSKALPKRTIFLQDCLGIISKVDLKHGHILVLYTKDDVFELTAETEELLNSWLNKLDKLHKMENTHKNLVESYYDLAWNVKVIPRGLGGIKNMTGSYKLCLKDDSLYFVNPTTQEVLNEEKLYHIRRYGHMDYCFFMEFGRLTSLGAGEIWMEVEDPLIAQKIHETLTRSARQDSAESIQRNQSVPKKPNRHSMVAYSSEKYAVELKNVKQNAINNNNTSVACSPKTRRLTSITNVFMKKKETSRADTKSMCAIPASNFAEGQDRSPRVSHLFSARSNATKDDEDSEEENKHYPRITPPVPTVPRRNKSSQSGSKEENISLQNEKKGADTLPRSEENVYTEINTETKRRRSVVKQNCNDVRKGYAAEKRRSASFPRNRSVSDADKRRLNSDVTSDGERTGDSGQDGGQESDKDEEDGYTSPPQKSHYLNMNPRQRLASDSSSEGPTTYVNVRQPPQPVDVYIKMSSPQTTPDLENTRTAARSPGFSHSSEDVSELVLGRSSYVNMAPQASRPSKIRGSSSTESADEMQMWDSGEETFDHLQRDDVTNEENVLSQSLSKQCYVNMSPGSVISDGGPLKKTQSQIHRSHGKSDYVNVNMNRSKSMGSKPHRPSPVFEITETSSGRSSDEESTGKPSPGSYVNMITTTNEANSSPDSSLSYENFMPHGSGENGVGRKVPLNYASVDFSEKNTSANGISIEPLSGRSSPSNYSKIDFKKSRGLADVSSTRERQLHGTQ